MDYFLAAPAHKIFGKKRSFKVPQFQILLEVLDGINLSAAEYKAE